MDEDPIFAQDGEPFAAPEFIPDFKKRSEQPKPAPRASNVNWGGGEDSHTVPPKDKGKKRSRRGRRGKRPLRGLMFDLTSDPENDASVIQQGGDLLELDTDAASHRVPGTSASMTPLIRPRKIDNPMNPLPRRGPLPAQPSTSCDSDQHTYGAFIAQRKEAPNPFATPILPTRKLESFPKNGFESDDMFVPEEDSIFVPEDSMFGSEDNSALMAENARPRGPTQRPGLQKDFNGTRSAPASLAIPLQDGRNPATQPHNYASISCGFGDVHSLTEAGPKSDPRVQGNNHLRAPQGVGKKSEAHKLSNSHPVKMNLAELRSKRESRVHGWASLSNMFHEDWKNPSDPNRIAYEKESRAAAAKELEILEIIARLESGESAQDLGLRHEMLEAIEAHENASHSDKGSKISKDSKNKRRRDKRKRLRRSRALNLCEPQGRPTLGGGRSRRGYGRSKDTDYRMPEHLENWARELGAGVEDGRTFDTADQAFYNVLQSPPPVPEADNNGTIMPSTEYVQHGQDTFRATPSRPKFSQQGLRSDSIVPARERALKIDRHAIVPIRGFTTVWSPIGELELDGQGDEREREDRRAAYSIMKRNNLGLPDYLEDEDVTPVDRQSVDEDFLDIDRFTSPIEVVDLTKDEEVVEQGQFFTFDGEREALRRPRATITKHAPSLSDTSNSHGQKHQKISSRDIDEEAWADLFGVPNGPRQQTPKEVNNPPDSLPSSDDGEELPLPNSPSGNFTLQLRARRDSFNSYAAQMKVPEWLLDLSGLSDADNDE